MKLLLGAHRDAKTPSAKRAFKLEDVEKLAHDILEVRRSHFLLLVTCAASPRTEMLTARCSSCAQECTPSKWPPRDGGVMYLAYGVRPLSRSLALPFLPSRRSALTDASPPSSSPSSFLLLDLDLDLLVLASPSLGAQVMPCWEAYGALAYVHSYRGRLPLQLDAQPGGSRLKMPDVAEMKKAAQYYDEGASIMPDDWQDLPAFRWYGLESWFRAGGLTVRELRQREAAALKSEVETRRFGAFPLFSLSRPPLPSFLSCRLRRRQRHLVSSARPRDPPRPRAQPPPSAKADVVPLTQPTRRPKPSTRRATFRRSRIAPSPSRCSTWARRPTASRSRPSRRSTRGACPCRGTAQSCSRPSSQRSTRARSGSPTSWAEPRVVEVGEAEFVSRSRSLQCDCLARPCSSTSSRASYKCSLRA